MFFDFGPDVNDEENSTSREENKLDISEVLKHIDDSDSDWFGTLPPEKKKLFTPYTVQRWVSSIDDSCIVTCSSKSIESVFGKWSAEGKKQINEFVETFNGTYPGMTCSAVQKYEHAKYDWRIKFSMSSNSASTEMIKTLKSFGCTSVEVIKGDDKQYAQDHLLLLNRVVNESLFDLNDHPELLYRMMCSVHKIIGKPRSAHGWMPFTKPTSNINSKVLQVMKLEHGVMDMNITEFSILLRDTSVEQFVEILEGQGCSDSEIKALKKLYKAEKEKHQ